MASRNTVNRKADYKFLSDVDEKLRCLICSRVARKALKHESCGKLFCKKCLEEHGERKPCLSCKEANPHYYVNDKSQITIQGLAVECDYASLGCNWQGTVATIEMHLAYCGPTSIPCPKKCKTPDKTIRQMRRQDAAQHLQESCYNRDYRCEFCGKEGPYCVVTQLHAKSCSARSMVSCPAAQCKKTMLGKDVSHHVAVDCEFTVISCKYEGIGCITKLSRRDMRAHEMDDKFHLQLAFQLMAQLQTKLTAFEAESRHKREGVIAKLEASLQAFTDRINLIEDKFRTLKKNEPFVFKLMDYQKKVDSNAVYSSVPFFTFANGYRMSIRVYANGRGAGEGTYLSVFVSILEGKYDAELSWPLLGTTTFTLLNQIGDCNHFSKVMTLSRSSAANVGGMLGFPKFISHSEILSPEESGTQYLVDDALYFNVSVFPKQKPWLYCTAK